MSENKKKTAITTNILAWGPSFFDFEAEKYTQLAQKLQNFNAQQEVNQSDWKNAAIEVIVRNTWLGSIFRDFLAILPLKATNQLFNVPYSAVNAFICENVQQLAQNDYFAVNLLEGLHGTDLSFALQPGEETVFDVTKDYFHDKLESLAAQYMQQYISFLSGNPQLTLAALLKRERWFRSQHSVKILAHDAATLCFDFACSCTDNDLFCSEVEKQKFEPLILSTCYLNSQGRCAVARTVQFMALLLRQFGVLENEPRFANSLSKLDYQTVKAFTDTLDKDMHVWNGYPHSFREQDLLVTRMRRAFFVNQQGPINYVPFELLDIALCENSHIAIGSALNRIALCFAAQFKDFELPSEILAVDGSQFANYLIPASLMQSIYQDAGRGDVIQHVKEQLQTCFSYENEAEDDIYASTPMMQLLYELQTAAKQSFEADCGSHLDIHYFALKVHFPEARFTELPEGLLLEFPDKQIFSLLAHGDVPEEYRCLKIESQRFQLSELESTIASIKTLQEGKLSKSLNQLSKLKLLGRREELDTLRLDNYVQETHALLQISKEYDFSQYNRAFETQMPFKIQIYGLLHRIIAYRLIDAILTLKEQKEVQLLDFSHAIDHGVLQKYQNTEPDRQVFQIKEGSGAGGLGKFMDLALWFCQLEMAQFFCYLNHGLTNRKLSLNSVARRLFQLQIVDRRARFVADFFRSLQQNDAKQYPTSGTTGYFPDIGTRFEELHPDKVAFILCQTRAFTKKEMTAIQDIQIDYSAESILLALDNSDVQKLYSALNAKPLFSYYLEEEQRDLAETKTVTFQALKEIDYFSQDMQLAAIANRRENGLLQLQQAAVKQINATLNDIRNGFLELAFRSFVFQVFCQCDHSDVNTKDQRERLAAQYLQILYILLQTDFRGGRFSKLLSKMVAYARISVQLQEHTEELPESCQRLIQAGINFFFIQSVEKTVQLIFYSKIYEQYRLQQRRLGPEIEKALRYRLLVLQNKPLRQENLARTAHLAFSEQLVEFLAQQQLSIVFNLQVESHQFLQLIADKELVEFDAIEAKPANAAAQPASNAEESIFPQFRYVVEESDSSHSSAEQASEHSEQQKTLPENDSPPGLNAQQSSDNEAVGNDAAAEDAVANTVQQDQLVKNTPNEMCADQKVNEVVQDQDFDQPQTDQIQIQPNDTSFDDLPPGLAAPHVEAPYCSIFGKGFQFSSDVCVLGEQVGSGFRLGPQSFSAWTYPANFPTTANLQGIEQDVHSFLYSDQANKRYLPLTSYHFMLAVHGKVLGTIFLPFQPINTPFYQRLFTCFPELQLLVTDYYLPQLKLFDSYRVHVSKEYFQTKQNLVENVLAMRQSIPPDILLLCKASFLSQEHILALTGLREYSDIAIQVFVPSQTTVAKTILGEYGSTVTLKCGHCVQFSQLMVPLTIDQKVQAKCPKCLQRCDFTVFVPLTPMQTDFKEIFGSISPGVFLQCVGDDAWLTDGRDCQCFDQFYYSIK